MSYNSSDEKQVKEAKSKAEINEALKLDVIRRIMKTAPGRSWIYGFLESCHIYGTPFIPGQSDCTFFNLGEANVGRRLLADVQNAAPEQYLQMIREAKSVG